MPVSAQRQHPPSRWATCRRRHRRRLLHLRRSCPEPMPPAATRASNGRCPRSSRIATTPAPAAAAHAWLSRPMRSPRRAWRRSQSRLGRGAQTRPGWAIRLPQTFQQAVPGAATRSMRLTSPARPFSPTRSAFVRAPASRRHRRCHQRCLRRFLRCRAPAAGRPTGPTATRCSPPAPTAARRPGRGATMSSQARCSRCHLAIPSTSFARACSTGATSVSSTVRARGSSTSTTRRPLRWGTPHGAAAKPLSLAASRSPSSARSIHTCGTRSVT